MGIRGQQVSSFVLEKWKTLCLLVMWMRCCGQTETEERHRSIFFLFVCLFFTVTVKKSILNKIQVSCLKIHCLWVHPVAVISLARIHLFWIKTTKQSQGECLRSVNHSCAYTAGSPPPSCTVGTVPAHTWSDALSSSPNCKQDKHPSIAQIKEKK